MISLVGGSLQGKIGSGYSGGKNYDLTSLDDGDNFSYASLDGTSLTVGAAYDDGCNDLYTDTGAVYLFTFSDTDFNGANLEGTIGKGYIGTKDINLDLDNEDYLGKQTSLNNNKLAASAFGDDGHKNLSSNTGAVYLFSFSDSAFNDGKFEAIIGDGYTSATSIDTSSDITDSDHFGTSVSLDANRLAVGVPYDNGFGGSAANSGSVFLYSFTDELFNGAILESIIGYDYTGGKNFSLNLEPLSYYHAADEFGCSVSLDGNRLAVGSFTQDGFPNISPFDLGGVYLFNFNDSVFNNPNLVATIGFGIDATFNENMIDNPDEYGCSVSLDGTRLAVGAYADEGASDTLSYGGAVYLYTFDDLIFTNPVRQAIIGSGYTGGKNINETAIVDDSCFGTSVSLDGNRLAVGVAGDDAFDSSRSDSGAVFLYTFTDDTFTGGSRVAAIGYNYTNGIDFNQTVDSGDNFGSSVSLSGNHLAVGAISDDGYSNINPPGAGAVYLYT